MQSMVMMVMRVVFLALFCCFAGLCRAETRVALVIGNAGYANVARLTNPLRDTAAMENALREIGFEVQAERDLGREALISALRRFEQRADKADWALVYYAGHGIEVGGVNYLIPVDGKLASDRDVDEETVSLSQVLKRLEGVRRLRMVILDACRDNPFATTMTRTLASRSVGRGLGRPELTQTGSLVAFSAAAGQVASDGVQGEVNSPYVAALVKHLAVPDVEVNLLFRRVRSEVLRATGNKQEPATYESLPEDRFVFRPLPLVPAASSKSTPPAPAGPIAALAPVVPVPAITPAGKASVERCDRLAASQHDADRPPGVAGIDFGEIDAPAAVRACREAVEAVEAVRSLTVAAPRSADDPTAMPESDDVERRRSYFQLGRAFDAQNRYDEARRWYAKAAAAGSVGSMSNLGALYTNGQGGAQDHAAARPWYEKAAAAGNAPAMTNLARNYENGWGVTRDPAAARTWYKKAATAGDAQAMTKLGVIYNLGQGVPRDYAAARIWFEKGAAAGDAMAMTGLGAIYTLGQGVARDHAAARFWNEKAAAAGNALAMTSLGLMYNFGLGVPRNHATARSWYEKGAAAGDDNARRHLRDLDRKR